MPAYRSLPGLCGELMLEIKGYLYYDLTIKSQSTSKERAYP
jgi:hypothetical protein